MIPDLVTKKVIEYANSRSPVKLEKAAETLGDLFEDAVNSDFLYSLPFPTIERAFIKYIDADDIDIEVIKKLLQNMSSKGIKKNANFIKLH